MAKITWEGWLTEVPKNLTAGGVIFGANLRKQSADNSTKQSDEEMSPSAKRYRLAAEQGDAEAQSNLGNRYANGTGVPQDYVQAYMWFNLAAAQGDEGARDNRNRVADMMTPAQIEEAQRLAREWLAAHP